MAIVAQRWTINALAVEMRLNHRTVARRLAKAPTIGTGEHNGPLYLLADVLPALLGLDDQPTTGPDLNHERARLARVQADQRELELAERRGELVEVSDIRAEVYALAKSARDTLVQLPARLSGQLVGLDQHGIERKLVEEIADICEQLRRPVLG